MMFKIAISLLLLIAVLAIFISPVVDLPRTALRSRAAAQTILLSLATVASLIVRFLSGDCQWGIERAFFATLIPFVFSPTKLKTEFLC